MTDNYYYVVSGLPEIILDGGKHPIQCTEFTAEMQEHLTTDDFQAFKLLLHPIDNKNLLTIMENRTETFDARGFFSEEQLRAGLKYPEDLPGYMEQYIEHVHEGHHTQNTLTPADMLWWFFYDEMCAHPIPFISSWFSYEKTLRNLVAAVNCKKSLPHLSSLSDERNTSVAAVVIGDDDCAEAITRSNSPDFGLGSLFPQVESVLTLASGPLTEFEKGLDTLRWNTLNDLTESLYFKAEMIFAFYIKLSIVERWHELDPKTGQLHLDRLIKELKGSYAVPSTF